MDVYIVRLKEYRPSKGLRDSARAVRERGPRRAGNPPPPVFVCAWHVQSVKRCVLVYPDVKRRVLVCVNPEPLPFRVRRSCTGTCRCPCRCPPSGSSSRRSPCPSRSSARLRALTPNKHATFHGLYTPTRTVSRTVHTNTQRFTDCARDAHTNTQRITDCTTRNLTFWCLTPGRVQVPVPVQDLPTKRCVLVHQLTPFHGLYTVPGV